MNSRMISFFVIHVKLSSLHSSSYHYSELANTREKGTESRRLRPGEQEVNFGIMSVTPFMQLIKVCGGREVGEYPT